MVDRTFFCEETYKPSSSKVTVTEVTIVMKRDSHTVDTRVSTSEVGVNIGSQCSRFDM
jgi:hypothetical protein